MLSAKMLAILSWPECVKYQIFRYQSVEVKQTQQNIFALSHWTSFTIKEKIRPELQSKNMQHLSK